MAAEYTCAICGETFGKGRSDEEAAAELKRDFGVPVELCLPVCDDCYRDWIALHPWCSDCGWRKGGVDSWDGRACKCGLREPPIERVE